MNDGGRGVSFMLLVTNDITVCVLCTCMDKVDVYPVFHDPMIIDPKYLIHDLVIARVNAMLRLGLGLGFVI